VDGAPEDDDPLREARAYHVSVYVMLGMPYLLAGAVGFLIYRSFKKARAVDLAGHDAGKPDEGDPECPSHVEDS